MDREFKAWPSKWLACLCKGVFQGVQSRFVYRLLRQLPNLLVKMTTTNLVVCRWQSSWVRGVLLTVFLRRETIDGSLRKYSYSSMRLPVRCTACILFKPLEKSCTYCKRTFEQMLTSELKLGSGGYSRRWVVPFVPYHPYPIYKFDSNLAGDYSINLELIEYEFFEYSSGSTRSRTGCGNRTMDTHAV